MDLKRIVTAGFFSLTLAVSGFAYAVPIQAEDDTTTDPTLEQAKAKNTGGTSALEAGDSIVLEFSETTNKYAIDATNIMTEFGLSDSHTFLDGAGAIGDATWSVDGEKLFIILSAGTSLPTVKVGDTVSIEGSNIKDLSGNVVTGEAVIEGSFTSVDEGDNCDAPVSTAVSGSNNDDDEDDADVEEDEDSNDDESDVDEDSNDDEDDCDEVDDHGKFRCGTGLQNGRLYRVEGSATVYLMANCRLRPFRGEAAFHSRGLKFQDIQTLTALPSTVSISDKPAVPADGTLVKGSDKTVWFVGENGKRKGFTREDVFLGLGFKFDEVDQISDTDLATIETDTDLVDDSNHHPDGALIKCGNSPAIFAVIGNLRFPFANADAFLSRGHSFEHVLVVDCGRFAYKEGPPVTE